MTMRSYADGCKMAFLAQTDMKEQQLMSLLANENSRFADDVIRAILLVDAGQADTAVLTVVQGREVKAFTVFGAWDGDVFSWRMMSGAYRKCPSVAHGEQVYAGTGDELDATFAAGRVCWLCAEMGGNWSVAA